MITLFRKKKKTPIAEELKVVYSVVAFTYPIDPESDSSEWSGGIVFKGHHNPLPKTYKTEEDAIETLQTYYHVANNCLEYGESYAPFMPISLYSSDEAESYISAL